MHTGTGKHCQLFRSLSTPIWPHIGMCPRKEFDELFFLHTLGLIQAVAGQKLYLQFLHIHAIPLSLTNPVS